MTKTLSFTQACRSPQEVDRLENLRARIAEAMPHAVLAGPDRTAAPATVSVSLPNGVTLSIACDVDVPWMLYELVRARDDVRPQKYEFETGVSPTCMFADKLSGDALLQLLSKYAEVPAL